ncbi:MAG: hypothetical protein QG622_3470 [Actinomycetota bacterium]|nr:hypothetical protein [Actinomycetota bacterium]
MTGCRPARELLLAGALPGTVAGAVVVAVSAVWSGEAVISALAGVVLASVALSAGPALLVMLRSASPTLVTPLALAVYGTVVWLMAVAFSRLVTLPWLSGGHVAAAISAVAVAWLAGMIRAVPRLRILAFGSGPNGAQGPGSSGQGGSPGSSPASSR